MSHDSMTFDIALLAKEIAAQILTEVRGLIAAERTKAWYTPNELADALGKAAFTIREGWCNAGRIECEKDEGGKWRIPGGEYQRLVDGGKPNPKAK
jgi:hypothetical protein